MLQWPPLREGIGLPDAPQVLVAGGRVVAVCALRGGIL